MESELNLNAQTWVTAIRDGQVTCLKKNKGTDDSEDEIKLLTS